MMAEYPALPKSVPAHDQQQSQIVLLAPHQDGTKQGWRCTLGRFSVGVDCSLKGLLRQSFPGHSGHMAGLT